MSPSPRAAAFTSAERALIRRLDTPQKVQRWLHHDVRYNFERDGKPTLRSLRRVVRDKKAHCLEGALAAAAILRQHGYPPLLLCMEARDIDHNLFIYRQAGRWGAVAKSRDVNLIGRDPVYPTLWDLVISYFPFYWNYWTGDKADLTLRGYATLKLGRFRRDWVTAEEDLWFIEDYLYGLPYRALFPRAQKRFFLSPKDGKLRYLGHRPRWSA
jgi:hypothetical protein